LFSVACEGIINSHPHVYRSALVGVGSDKKTQSPVIVVEPWPEHFPADEKARQELFSELQSLAKKHEVTRTISRFMVREKLPVDIRHNSKIFREQLAVWAGKGKLP